MPRRTHGWRAPLRWLVAGALVTATGAIAAGSGASASGCSATVKPAGTGWQQIAPHFQQGSAGVAFVSSPSFEPDTIYASNGTEIMRSFDDGCNWQTVFEATNAKSATLGGVVAQSATITSVAAPSSANSSRYLYVGVNLTVAGIAQPIVAVSDNEGATWFYAGQEAGLPAVGSVGEMSATADLPLTGYAVVTSSVAGTDVTSSVYRTADGGQTWTDQTPLGSSFRGTSLTAGPSHDTEVFSLVSGAVAVSEDGGATWGTAESPGSGQLTSLALAVGGSGFRIAAGHSNDPSVDIANPWGRQFASRSVPIVATNLAYAPLQDTLAIADGQQLYLDSASLGVGPITPTTGAVSQMVFSAPTARGYSLIGLSANEVVRVTLSLISIHPPPVPPDTPVHLLPPGAVHQFPAVLIPGPHTVTLRPGASTDVPYRLFLPRVPTPLDVMFLVDTTGSMQNVIDGLRQDLVAIANALDVSGLDVEIGLGDFRDYPDPYGGGSPGDYPYQRDARIQVPDAALQAAIGKLSASGGGDTPESDLAALYQSTTGAGDIESGHTFVVPSQQAGYREEALRLAVLATDSPFHQGGQPTTNASGTPINYPGPTFDQTISAMLKRGVHQVGLAAASDSMTDLTTVARGTHTFAPAGGVDCNGDGTVDVPAGSPLVCPIGGSSGPVSVGVGVDGAGVGNSGGNAVPLTGAVVGLAEALPDYQPVGLEITQGASVASIGRSLYPSINVKADNELGYVVHLSCPVAAKTTTTPVGLAASVATRPVATDGVSLTCLGTKAAAALPPAAGTSLLAAPLSGIGAGAPPAPPEPVPNPNPQPNPNPNPNPNVNVNVGMAEQEQVHQQLALAYLDGIRAQDTVELAMSRRNPDPSSMLFLGAAALTAAAAGAVATSRARSFAIRRAHVR